MSAQISSGKLFWFKSLVRNQLSGLLLFLFLFCNVFWLAAQVEKYCFDRVVNLRIKSIAPSNGMPTQFIFGLHQGRFNYLWPGASNDSRWISTGQESLYGLKVRAGLPGNKFYLCIREPKLGPKFKSQFRSNKDYLHSQWVAPVSKPVLQFTSLNPGIFFFGASTTNNNAILNKNETLPKTSGMPPWYATKGMIAFYFLLAIVAIIALREYELSRIRLRNLLQIAELEAAKLKELDHLKSRFFANISHEFRTPLTLILGPIEKMELETRDPKTLESLSVAHRNARKLLTLINQLLDLSKLESGNYSLRVSNGDFTTLLQGLVMSFASMAEQNKIRLEVGYDPNLKTSGFAENFFFDADIIEKIVGNLLSNAFKFTPEKGKIKVEACLIVLEGESQMVEIIFSDSGIGIPAANLPFIFDRFYQVDSSSKREYEGSGIGLAFVRELVNVHKGTIYAKSQPGRGTTFSVRLPVGKDHYLPGQIFLQPNVVGKKGTSKSTLIFNPQTTRHYPTVSKTGLPLVLVVEDHADVRQFISDCLSNHFRIKGAKNSLEGLRFANEMIPDLIISDIMMPLMDGFELCKKLKLDEKTSHIPVILLTARAEDSEKLRGYEAGADDYLIKPFNPAELLTRAINLVENRQLLREKFTKSSIIKPGEITVTPRDRFFIENIMAIMEKNIGNPQFTVNHLAIETTMSQSQLHRKLKALINQTANHFIRSVRMHHAKKLLEANAGNVAEIAYMVGYDDPGYFSRTYKSFFGILPSSIKKNHE